jgi:hypothetical protein
MSEQLRVLRLTRDRIADERNWCQGRKNEFGKSVDGEQGDRKCLWAALCAVAGSFALRFAEPLLVQLGCSGLRDLEELFVFNDTHSHAEVVALLDDVIARLEEHEFGDPLPVPVDEYEPALD